MVGSVIDTLSSILDLLPDELVLLVDALILHLLDFTLSLGIFISEFVFNLVQNVLRLLLLLAHLHDGCNFILDNVRGADPHISLLVLLPLIVCHSPFQLVILPLLALLFNLLSILSIVFFLEVRYVLSLTPGFLNFLARPLLLLLEHPDSVAELLDVPLNLESN